MTTKMFAVITRENHVVFVAPGYWTIINRFKARRAADFYAKHPHWRIKRCTVTIP